MPQKIIIPLLIASIFLAMPCAAQEEVAGSNRYKMREMSTGYYEQYEVMPNRGSPFIQWNAPSQTVTTGGRAPAATYQANAHALVPNYRHRRCESCHKAEALNNRHVTRQNIACRQCHGSEPIAGINHYFSKFNPIRRHASVCAKCHQGANGSFAMYVVHEPAPLLAGTATSFPALYWVAWAMVTIAMISFALFLPHTGLWIVRELFSRTKEGGDK